MKAYEIVAYTYDAAYHCCACTLEKFPNLCDTTEDSEGNPIHSVYADNEDWEDQTCDDCLEKIGDTL